MCRLGLPWVLLLGAGCATSPRPWMRVDSGPPPETARLTARPGPVTHPLAPGLHPLGLSSSGRDGLLYVPAQATKGPVPLLVMLHGAGGSSKSIWEVVRHEAEDRGLAVLLPDSRDATWNFRHGDFGPDLQFIDTALRSTFASVPVNPSHVILGGFSLGGIVVLSLGPSNGDLFGWILAYSPPGIDVAGWVGKPKFYVAHGTADPLVNIASSSRTIVPMLRSAGAYVVYREFEGGHEVPDSALQEGLTLALE